MQACFEGGGLRIALAVDSFIYFANIRPNYKVGGGILSLYVVSTDNTYLEMVTCVSTCHLHYVYNTIKFTKAGVIFILSLTKWNKNNCNDCGHKIVIR